MNGRKAVIAHDSISREESLPMTRTQEALRAEDLPQLGAEE